MKFRIGDKVSFNVPEATVLGIDEDEVSIVVRIGAGVHSDGIRTVTIPVSWATKIVEPMDACVGMQVKIEPPELDSYFAMAYLYANELWWYATDNRSMGHNLVEQAWERGEVTIVFDPRKG